MKALYRKYRPRDFESLVGQKHIIDVLKNQINQGGLSHAYVFSGIRGTGKTSTAKIFARAVNCLDYDSEKGPCNKCENCLNDNMYTIELDAASNNSVEDIRELKDTINYLPNQGKYKVYIVDEFHMLSPSAFNAFLKTLEEPPSHVIFILATTEIQKIPDTILSRCQRFSFRKIDASIIADRLEFIAKSEGVEYDRAALDEIAIYSDGGLRDAISLLDQIMSYGSISIENFNYVIGFSSQKDIDGILMNLVNKNSVDALLSIKNISDNGLDIKKLPLQLIIRLREVIYKQNSIVDPFEITDMESLENLASSLNKNDVLDLIVSLSDLEARMKYSMAPQILLETFVISHCRGFDEISSSNENAVALSIDNDKINMLEKRIEYLEGSLNNILGLIKNGSLSFNSGNTGNAGNTGGVNNFEPSAKAMPSQNMIEPPMVEPDFMDFDSSSAVPDSASVGDLNISIEYVRDKMQDVYAFIKQNGLVHVATMLEYGKIASVNGNIITITYEDNNFILKRIKEPKNIDMIKKAFDFALNGVFKIDVRYESEFNSGNPTAIIPKKNASSEVVESIKSVFGDDIPINIK